MNIMYCKKCGRFIKTISTPNFYSCIESICRNCLQKAYLRLKSYDKKEAKKFFDKFLK